MGYEGGMHVIRDKDARDSGQLLFFREKCCIFALCVRRKAALGKVQASLTLLSFALSLHCRSEIG